MKKLNLLLLLPLLAVGCNSTPDQERESEDRAIPKGAMIRWAQRLSEDGTMPDNAIMRMKGQRDEMVARQREMTHVTALENWQWLGPGNIGGRIRGICIHPTNPNIMWIGSVSGGIWKTTDGGTSWTPLDDFAPVLTVGSMTMDPTNPDRIYAGTGEGFFNTIPGSSILAASKGSGIFVTDDGGTTWNQIPSTASSDYDFVNRIAISPVDNTILLVAANGGLMRSTDSAGSFSIRDTDFFYDVDFHPTDGSKAIAGTRDGWAKYSEDGGTTWNTAAGIPLRQRVEVAYATGSPSTVYAAVSQNNRITIYRSTDGGKNYTLRTTGSGISTWSRYNTMLWVDPADASAIILGGVYMYKSLNGGISFTTTGQAHADYHVVEPHPGYNGTTNQTVFIGNDGGIHRTTNFRDANVGNISWTELNNNLGITQFYGAAMGPDGVVIGGTQDNGTLRFNGGTDSWDRPIGGDGGYSAADHTDPDYLYGERQNMRIYRSSNGGNSFTQIANSTNIPDTPNFIPYFRLDPNDANRMYIAAGGLWRTDNVKAPTPVFTQVKAPVTCATGGSGNPPPGGNDHFNDDPHCNISNIAIVEGNPNIVWVGHNDGLIFKSTDATSATPTWTQVSNATLPHRWVGSLAIDPRNTDRVYACFLGYEPDNVWVTEDGGATWNLRTGTGVTALPSAPANWITLHPLLSSHVFVGTDIGLFYSRDDGATWETTTEGSKTSPVAELQWKNRDTLIVTTHGRGIYTADYTITGSAGASTAAGAGCSSGTGPVLTATSPNIGTTQVYQVTGPLNTQGLLMVAMGTPGPMNFGNGCLLYAHGPGTAYIPIDTGVGGLASFLLDIPPTTAIIGLTATAQAGLYINGGPLLGIAELSNALSLVGGIL